MIFGIGNGEINMNSDFGMYIYKVCLNENIENIFEVGCWNGQGSTICVINYLVVQLIELIISYGH